jgi:hypothetical protein
MQLIKRLILECSFPCVKYLVFSLANKGFGKPEFRFVAGDRCINENPAFGRFRFQETLFIGAGFLIFSFLFPAGLFFDLENNISTAKQLKANNITSIAVIS